MVLIHEDNTDEKEWRVGMIARRLGFPLPLGVHCTVVVDEIEFALTTEGVDACVCDDEYDPLAEPFLNAAYVFRYDFHAHSYERAQAMLQAQTRLETPDLLRCATGMEPHGLVCSTFVLSVLGLNAPGRWRPEDMIELVMNTHTEGVLYVRE